MVSLIRKAPRKPIKPVAAGTPKPAPGVKPMAKAPGQPVPPQAMAQSLLPKPGPGAIKPTPGGMKPQPPGAIPVPKYEAKNENISELVADVYAKNAPLMKLAETKGLQLGNSRGLLNSSMAVGAAQNEIMKVAGELGAQQALINSNSNIERQRFEQSVYSDRLKNRFTASENKKDRDFKADEAQLDRRYQAGERRKDRNFNGRENALDRKFNSRERELDRGIQREIANWNLDAADKNAVGSLLLSYQSTYEGALDAIMKNPDLSKEQRNFQIKQLNKRRENLFSRVQAVYGIDADISWPALTGDGGNTDGGKKDDDKKDDGGKKDTGKPANKRGSYYDSDLGYWVDEQGRRIS